jgi:hypothetical protein
MAGPISAAVKGVTKRAAKSASKMHPLDELLAQIPNPETVTNAQLRKLEKMIPNLNAAQRKRATEFIGLSPDAKFPNQTVLGRAGMIEPENLGKFPESPGGMFPEAPAGRFPEAPLGRFPEAPAGRFPEVPAGHFPQLPEGFQKPQRTGKMSAMMGALGRNKGKIGLGIGAGGIGAASMMGGDESEASGIDSILDSLEAGGLAPMASHGGIKSASPKPTRVGGGGMRSPKPSGLTGQNGISDISSMLGNFGAPEVDFEGMVADDVNRPLPQFEEQKKGGGMGDILKTMGPLLAALLFGKMLG